jgi:hypothetical protein
MEEAESGTGDVKHNCTNLYSHAIHHYEVFELDE